MRYCRSLIVIVLTAGISCLSTHALAGEAAGTSGLVLRVGPNKQYKTIAAAANAVKMGDTVEIDAGLYKGDVAHWKAANLLIRGVGGMAHLDADGKNEGGKAIWLVGGRNMVIENIEFSGCRVEKNGAGIRIEAENLTVRNCYFHDNDDGILGGKDNGDVLIEFCEFFRNGHGDGQSHNIYIGNTRSFTLRYCYTHGAKIGHNIKSRALKNMILYNRIMDETDGTASYEIDLPDGGLSFVIGNLVHKGSKADNGTLLCYSEEKGRNPDHRLYVVNNTFVSDYDKKDATFIHIKNATKAVVMNNLFIGHGKDIVGDCEASCNLATRDEHVLVDCAHFDYRLTAGSAAQGQGKMPDKADDFSLIPVFQYVDKSTKATARLNQGAFDIGAYEAGFVPSKKSDPAKVVLGGKSDPKKTDVKVPADLPKKTDTKVAGDPPAQPKRPVERTPDQICGSWFLTATNYKNSKLNSNAIDYFEKIIETYPTNPWADKAREELKLLK